MILLSLLQGTKGIKGDSEIEKHVEWITCSSMSFDMKREEASEPSPKGGGKDVFAGLADVGEIVVTKTCDCATPDLMEYAASGAKVVNTGKIHFLISGLDEAADDIFLEVILDSPIIASWDFNASDEDSRPTETVRIRYEKVSVKYWSFGDKASGPRGWWPKKNEKWTDAPHE